MQILLQHLWVTAVGKAVKSKSRIVLQKPWLLCIQCRRQHLDYYGKEESDIIIVSVYVDDFLLAFKHQTSIDWIKKNLKRE